jgi:hypothetical protein
MWLPTLSAGGPSAYVRAVATFLIERYLSRERPAELDAQVAAITRAIAELVVEGVASGTALRHRRSYFVSDDETCFHVLDAPSSELVEEVARRAGLVPERIMEVAAGA